MPNFWDTITHPAFIIIYVVIIIAIVVFVVISMMINEKRFSAAAKRLNRTARELEEEHIEEQSEANAVSRF